MPLFSDRAFSSTLSCAFRWLNCRVVLLRVLIWVCMGFRVRKNAASLKRPHAPVSRGEPDPFRVWKNAILDAYAGAWISLWEVAKVQPGTGSRLVDMLTREERFVRDVGPSNTLERFDTALAVRGTGRQTVAGREQRAPVTAPPAAAVTISGRSPPRVVASTLPQAPLQSWIVRPAHALVRTVVLSQFNEARAAMTRAGR